MEVKIEKKEEMIFTGYVTDILISKGKGYDQIPKLWQKVTQEGLFNQLAEYSDELGPVGISYDFDMKTGDFKYMIGIRNNIDQIEHTKKLSLDAQAYAVIKVIGPLPSALQHTITYFHNQWLPQSEYSHSGKAEIEIYSNGDPSKDDYVSYFWASVKHK